MSNLNGKYAIKGHPSWDALLAECQARGIKPYNSRTLENYKFILVDTIYGEATTIYGESREPQGGNVILYTEGDNLQNIRIEQVANWISHTDNPVAEIDALIDILCEKCDVDREHLNTHS